VGRSTSPCLRLRPQTSTALFTNKCPERCLVPSNGYLLSTQFTIFKCLDAFLLVLVVLDLFFDQLPHGQFLFHKSSLFTKRSCMARVSKSRTQTQLYHRHCEGNVSALWNILWCWHSEYWGIAAAIISSAWRLKGFFLLWRSCGAGFLRRQA
jgi:hypothetical protein